VTASQAGNGSYEPASAVTHLFYIAKASQTITFNPPTAESYGTAPFKLSGTASSGLPVSYSGTGSCTVTAAGEVTVTGVGDCEVTASQSGSSDYEAAEPKTSVIVITPMATKVALTPAKKTSEEEKKIKFKAVVTAAQAGFSPSSGSVAFYINGTLYDSQVLNKKGIATYIYYVDLPVSASGYPVTAVFTSGDGDYSSSTSNTTTLKIKA
jgi:hypothetical protein